MNGWSPVGGRVFSQYLCGVPSERLNGMPRLPRVAPWAGMRRPVGALAEMPPFRTKCPKSRGVLKERRIYLDYERQAEQLLPGVPA